MPNDSATEVARHELRTGGVFYIADSGLAKPYYDELEKLIRQEWPDVQTIDGDGISIPGPLVALMSDDILIGGLSFAAAKSPSGDEPAVWINAVLVSPRYRRQGVGRRLIAAAREAAARIGVARLYALTEVPDLYSSLGWTIVSNDGADFVVSVDIDARP